MLSVIVPVFNEEDNIPLLCRSLFEVMESLGQSFEVIAVNDGSSDGSLAVLRREAAARPQLKVVNFRRNYGQTAAMMAGIDHASGEVLISIDADLQNDPRDIPKLLEKIAEGYDVVSGWRTNRQDAAIRRNFVSRIANRVISRISGVTLHDYGCTLKAYHHDVIKDVRLYGEMHRFIPIYASWMGAKICEIPVGHHARKFGVSKYGLSRIFKVILDLLIVKFLDRHFVKPIYVFGGFGLFSLVLSILSGTLALWLKFVNGISFVLTPLPLLTVMTFLVAAMSLLMGILSEMIVRTFYESSGRSSYLVRERINFGND
ncbi:MAG: glycosyltransferase family 2 protein [Alphaproteobacteria bacterium]|nr:glycosyltransferase family 2 protein [Alphaproteobacteria bacterium]